MAFVLAFVGLAVLVGLHELVFRTLRGRRAVGVIVAGAVSYLAIVAVAFTFYMVHGIDLPRGSYMVSEVVAGMPAAGKLEVGDRIVGVDGAPIVLFHGPTLVERISAGSGAPVALTIDRGGARSDVMITPVRKDDHFLVGIKPRTVLDVEHDAGRAMRLSLYYPLAVVKELVPDGHGDPGGPKRFWDEYTLEQSTAERTIRLLILVATIALLLHLIYDVVRLVRARP